ncbi:MAG TPA: hypothetical protein VGO66_12380 [Solirubrobacterales bacterium]|jgi:hypothetical protein|nr:hypothetical protein [Solirubrobacterales bacterium]
MNNRALSHATLKSLTIPIALLTAAVMLLIGLCGSASAARSIGKGGSIQACYKVKGKQKGAMRVVPTGKKCKKSERKLAWRIAGIPGQTGSAGSGGAGGGSGSATGQNGTDGGSGANGTNGSNGNTATLESKIAGLNLKIDGLEKVLDGLNNGELTGVVDTVDGLTNGQLKGVVDTLDGVTNGQLKGALDSVDGLSALELGKAVDSLPVLESICDQTSGLTGGLDAVNEGIKGLSILGLPSLSLGNLGILPNNLLDEYNCPAL